ncbi:MAG: hypothetical protein KUG73_15190 [Pseudomonadales bacterium]|nr:hypothetical protein [Pseudomonadales bacterium]
MTSGSLCSIKKNITKNQKTYLTSNCSGYYKNAFTLVIHGKLIKGQFDVDLETDSTSKVKSSQGYIYRAITTNQDEWNDSQIILWYNQRVEDRENRIKGLKLNFSDGTTPCSDFKYKRTVFFTDNAFL